MNILIETATTDDLASINDIYNHYVQNSNATFDTHNWDEQRRKDWFEQFNKPESCYTLLVAKSQEQVIGFAYNAMFKEKQAYFTSSEVTVYVKPDAAGHGIGSKLYDVLLARITSTSIHRLYAAITIPNPASIKLHQQHGFILVGTMNEVGFKNDQFHCVSLFEKKVTD